MNVPPPESHTAGVISHTAAVGGARPAAEGTAGVECETRSDDGPPLDDRGEPTQQARRAQGAQLQRREPGGPEG